MKPYPSFEKPATIPSESENDQIDDQSDIDMSLFGTTKKEKDQDKEQETKKTDTKESKHKKDKKEKEQQDGEKEKKAVKKPEKPKEEDPEVKRRKRATLVERSFYYKKHYQEVPIPRNPWVIARLMVAEHILAIHNQIEQPVNHENATDELTLLATLDYMGVIADKLENPEIESTPEVEETIETIVQLATETLEEGDDDIAKAVITANGDTVRIQSSGDSEISDQQKPLVSPPAVLPPVAVALISIIQHARQDGAIKVIPHTDTEQPADDHHTPAARPAIGFGGGTNSRPAPPTVIPHREVSTYPTTPTIGAPAAVVATQHFETPRTHHLPAKQEVFSRPSHRSAEPLATLAVATALATPRAAEQRSAVHEYTTVHPSAPQNNTHEQPDVAPSHSLRVTRQNELYRPQQPPAIHTPVYTGPTHETLPSASAPLHTERTYSSRELEHMRLEPLLRLAENVPVGHGQRLRRAYEKGLIDKEGLVKILKSRAKNHDFLREYSQQVTKQRNLVQTSPEFLHSAPSKDNQFTPNQKNEPAQNTGITSTPPSAAPVRPIALPSVKPTQQTSTNDPLSAPDEKTSNSSWLIITLGAVLVLVVLVLFLFFVV